MLKGGVPEWPNGADCKSAGVRLRWFESIRPHSLCHNELLRLPVSGEGKNECGSSSAGRAIAFQAIGREFEPRLSLTIKRWAVCWKWLQAEISRSSSAVEHFLGKEEVVGSSPIFGSKD